ncbi:EAL domain-containing protein [Cryobacterium sp. 1639]|uniref:putative bifunctional diguanylate cyclase/phosphodiesterase n=1 Tax=Cryobacterium inferilacus TaxID=2866629 RepID=UPI001C730BE7|nr:EAL domain-containing protein [Cryobacterium sp. 1639]MBX0301266.1 EAL domain-containing protein [Cryobacterium sp. 1639]
MNTVGEWSTPVTPARIGLRQALPTLLRRPDGILQGTRWLFTWLAMLSLLFTLPAVFVVPEVHPFVLLLGTVAALTLWASHIYGYLRQRVPFGLEILDAVALTALAVACATPSAVAPLLFACAWVRTLYGSRWRSTARGVLYTAAYLTAAALWPLVPEHTTAPTWVQQIGVVSIMALTITVSAQLRIGLQAHDWAIERDRALTKTGAKLLGLTDPDRIRGLAWTTANELGSTTPGLRVLKASRDGDVLRIGASTGQFATLPVTVPGSVVNCTGAVDDARVADDAPLNDAVGTALKWECVPLTEEEDDAWLLIGAPRRIPEGTLLSVRGLVNQVNLALRNSDAHRQLTAQAESDPLTGLDNRATFTTKLATALDEQGAEGGLHVLFLDLDDFKDVNDQLGHHAGDAVLTEVAARLQHSIRPQDVCARLGGDEFAVVLTGTTDDDALAIGQRMVGSLAAPITFDGRPVLVNASVGVASARPGIDLDALVHQADVAMYAAKANGKGRVRAFTVGLLQGEPPLVTFERQVARAAGNAELVVHYQPVVSLTDLRCTGAEALVRWQHPERGLLQPEEFVALAETSGAIVGIGAFVLRRACADAMTWPEVHPGVPMTVQVNVSARELDSDNFVASVLWCLADSGLPADRLVLELTETVMLESAAAVGRLKTLAGHGIHIAIDDFGTGYASLSTLRMLPITVVKLDSSFVVGALANAVDRSVVEAIVQMSAKLGITTIAEGVERPDHQEQMAEIGADSAQGHLYSRALPLDQLLEWLNLAERAG